MSGNILLFDGDGELAVSDGTAAGTFVITPSFSANENGLIPQYIIAYGGEALFEGQDSDGEYGLWITNGTAPGTTELGGIGSTGVANANPTGLGPGYFQVYNGDALFRGEAGVAGDDVPGLWETNGTVSGTFEIGGAGNAGISNISPGGLLPSDPDFTVFNGVTLFSGRDAANNQGLWETNGTASGTYEIYPITGAFSVGSPGSDIQPRFMTVVGNEVIFNGADDEDTPGSLWETNGTAAGTVEIGGEGNAGIADAPAGFTGPFTSELALGMQPNDITAFDGEAIFAAFDSTIDSAGYYADADTLWMTNGTASGTVEIGGAQNAGIAGANPALDGGIFWGGSIEYPDFTVYDGKALFVGYDAAGHAGLWETDGTAAGTVEIGGLGGAGIAGGLSLLDSQTPDFTVYNGEVYFIGYNASNQAGLWVTNGTAAGTYEVDAGYPSAPLGVASLSDDYVGGGQVIEINGAGGGEVILFDTGGNVDKVFGSNGTVDLVSAQASVIGQNDVILFQGGTGNQVKLFNTNGEDDKVFGSSEIAYVVDAQAKFIGGDDSIRCSGSGDAVKLFSTAGQLDKVFGFNLNVGVVSAQASIIDGDDTIHCSGTGDEVKLFATIGEYDKVFGAGVNAYLINAQASFIQGGDTIHLLNGQDDSIKLFATGSDADTVDGANGTIFVIGAEVSVTGSGSSIRMFDNDTVSVSGTSEAFVFQPAIGEDVINGFGSSDTMQFSASDFANFTALQTHMSKSGANTVITLDANDTVTLDNVAMSSLTASQFKFA